MADRKLRVLGIVCDRCIIEKEFLNADKSVKGLPETKVILLPCSGMIQPRFAEEAFDSGTDAVFLAGCMVGDCYFRNGNEIIQERIEGKRAPKLKSRYPRDRFRLFFNSKIKTEDLIEQIGAFIEQVRKTLSQTVVEQKK